MSSGSPVVVDTLLDAGRVSRRTIVLVHGTWGRGFFPKRRDASLYPPNKRWWFEEGSQFRMRLDEALKAASLDWQIRAFLWSGANSVHARDCAASELSHQLTIDLQDPEARVVIVAHSHGGNVALRALQRLDSKAGKIKVVTLATPFLRVFARRSWQLPLGARILVYAAMFMIVGLTTVLSIIGLGREQVESVLEYHPLVAKLVLATVEVLLGAAGIFIGRWLIAVLSKPQAALAIERAAGYDTRGASASRMLIIRGVDDEASLSLAAGSIGSRLSYLVLTWVIPGIYVMIVLAMMLLYPVLRFSIQGDAWTVWLGAAFLGTIVCAPIFLILPGVVRSIFFGREFLVNALACDIAVDSVPDTVDQVEAITLRKLEAGSSEPGWISWGFGLKVKWPYRSSERRFSLAWWSDMIRIWWRGWRTREFLKPAGQFKLSWQLHHGIYNHPDCIDDIVRWLRRVT